MVELFDELKAVVGALDDAAIPCALVGGMAYSIWVETRATEDIDLLVMPEDWPRIGEVLAPLGYRELAAPMDFKTVRIRRLTKLKDSDAIVLDFLLADGALARGVTDRVILKRGAQTYALAPPEVIIALKRGRMSAKDQSDIEGLENLIREARQ